MWPIGCAVTAANAQIPCCSQSQPLRSIVLVIGSCVWTDQGQGPFSMTTFQFCGNYETYPGKEHWKSLVSGTGKLFRASWESQAWGPLSGSHWGHLTPATAIAGMGWCLGRLRVYEVHHNWKSILPDINIITMVISTFLVKSKKSPFKWQVIRIVTIALKKNHRKKMISSIVWRVEGGKYTQVKTYSYNSCATTEKQGLCCCIEKLLDLVMCIKSIVEQPKS